MRKIILGFLLVIGLQTNAQIVTDRPDQTESAVTVGKANIQIESGIQFSNFGNASTSEFLLPTTLFRYGITNGIELRFVAEYNRLKIQDNLIDGLNDLQLGTKIEIAELKNAKIAYIGHVSFPSGRSGLSLGVYGTNNKISISHVLTDKLSLGYNIGHDYRGRGVGTFLYTISFALSLTDKLGVYIEPYGSVVEFKDSLFNGDAGATYLVNDKFQLDASFGVGLNNNMQYVAAGFSWFIDAFNSKVEAESSKIIEEIK